MGLVPATAVGAPAEAPAPVAAIVLNLLGGQVILEVDLLPRGLLEDVVAAVSADVHPHASLEGVHVSVFDGEYLVLLDLFDGVVPEGEVYSAGVVGD